MADFFQKKKKDSTKTITIHIYVSFSLNQVCASTRSECKCIYALVLTRHKLLISIKLQAKVWGIRKREKAELSRARNLCVHSFIIHLDKTLKSEILKERKLDLYVLFFLLQS